MNICILTNGMDPKMGGGRFASDLVRGLRTAGSRVLVLKENDDGHEGHAVLARGCGIIGSVFRSLRYVRDCDIIHALDLYPFGIIAYLVACVTGKPYIITMIGTYSLAPLSHRQTAWMSRMVLRNTAHLTAISHFTRERVLSRVPGLDIRVIIPGIWPSTWTPRMTEGHLVTVLGVGALKRRKGYHIAIPAFAEVYAQFPGSRFIIVGDQRDAEYFSELRNLVAKYDLADAVEFRQDMDDADLGHLYDSATVFLLPSVNEGDHVEGFGLVFLEAAAHGVPAIGTKGNGISDAVIDGETGMLVAQENVMATAHALLTLLGDRGLRESMSRRSIEWARRNDWSTIAREYEQLYASISN